MTAKQLAEKLLKLPKYAQDLEVVFTWMDSQDGSDWERQAPVDWIEHTVNHVELS